MVEFSDLSVGMTVHLKEQVSDREKSTYDVVNKMLERLGHEVTISKLSADDAVFPTFRIEEDKGDCYWAVELIDHIVVEEELPTIAGDPLSMLA